MCCTVCHFAEEEIGGMWNGPWSHIDRVVSAPFFIVQSRDIFAVRSVLLADNCRVLYRPHPGSSVSKVHAHGGLDSGTNHIHAK